MPSPAERNAVPGGDRSGVILYQYLEKAAGNQLAMARGGKVGGLPSPNTVRSVIALGEIEHKSPEVIESAIDELNQDGARNQQLNAEGKRSAKADEN